MIWHMGRISKKIKNIHPWPGEFKKRERVAEYIYILSNHFHDHTHYELGSKSVKYPAKSKTKVGHLGDQNFVNYDLNLSISR